MKPTHLPHGIKAGLVSLLSLFLTTLVSAQTPSSSGSGQSDETVLMNPFAVSSGHDQGYNSRDAVGAGRINSDLSEIAQRVTVLNRELLQDTGTISIFEAAKFIAGFGAAAAPESGSYVLRGFNFVSDQRDGFPDGESRLGTAFFDDSLFDRVELVNGPSGVLYGQTSPGGVINRITKRPLPRQQTSVSLMIGEFNLKRASVDVTGPINSKLSYRVIVTDQDAKNWVGNINDHKIVHGALNYQITPETSIYLSYTWDHAEICINSPDLWAGPGGKTFSTFLNSNVSWLAERDQENNNLVRNLDLEVLHTIRQSTDVLWNSRLKIRYINATDSRNLYQNTGAASNYYNAAGAVVGNINTLSPLDPSWTTFVTNRVVNLSSDFVKLTEVNYDLNNTIQFDKVQFSTLMYGGFNYSSTTSNQYSYPTPPVIVYHQADGGRAMISNPTSLWGTPTLAALTNTDAFTPNGGALLTAEAFNKQIILTGGARYDYGRSTATNLRVSTNAIAEPANQQWSRRWGVIIKPDFAHGLSAYYNHSEVFTFSTGFDNHLGIIPPNVIASVNEEGLRGEFLDGRIMLGATYYDGKVANNQVNSGLVDANNLTIFLYEQSINKGEEYEAWLNITQNWSLLLTLANVSSRTATGLRSRGVPEGISDTAWSKYEFHSGLLKSLSVAAGFVHTGDRAADGADTINLPAYDQVDAMISYRIAKAWRAQVNVLNIFDDQKPAYGTGNIYVYRNLPRRVRFSTEYTF